MEVYAAVRRFVFVEGNSRGEAARVFGLSRETVGKMCRFSRPPDYTRTEPVAKPNLGTLLPVIDEMLEIDWTAPVKQRHTAKRIFERMRDEHSFAGGYTVAFTTAASLVNQLPEARDERRLLKLQRELGAVKLLIIGDPTYADAILDSLVHNAHRLDLEGESLRRTKSPPPT